MIILKVTASRVINMEASQHEKLKEYTQEIARILYADADPEKIKTLEGIEETIREQLLEYINPEIGNFLSRKVAKLKQEESER